MKVLHQNINGVLVLLVLALLIISATDIPQLENIQTTSLTQFPDDIAL